MKFRTCLFILVLALATGACGLASARFAAIDSCLDGGRAWNYRSLRCERAGAGPIDLIRVDKSAHLMSVYRAGRLVRELRVALGRGGLGPKLHQGDGRVPEGRYRITAHNPHSAYHLALRIGYPTAEQLIAAHSLGIDPGGDIMIHGLPDDSGGVGSRHILADWTDGCVALTNREIEWLYPLVRDGTPIEIRG